MSTRLICDTNIWYNLSNGSINFSDVCKDGEELFCTPLSIIEIIGGITWRELIKRRKGACSKIAYYQPRLLSNSEAVLAEYFGVRVTQSEAANKNLMNSAGIIAGGMFYSETSNIVSMVYEGKPYFAPCEFYRVWRNRNEKKFKDEVISYIKKVEEQMVNAGLGTTLPVSLTEYYSLSKEERSNRKLNKPKLTKDQRAWFESQVRNPDAFGKVVPGSTTRLSNKNYYVPQLILGSLARVLNSEFAPITYASITWNAPAYVNGSLVAFASIWYRYFVNIITQDDGMGLKWDVNDRVDVENFVYSNDENSIVVTSDEKWWDLAVEAGYENRVRYIPLKGSKK